MMANAVFLDANAIIYALDETSVFYNHAVSVIQKLLQDNNELCTSHHVIEEVIYIAVKSTGGEVKPVTVVEAITKIPGLVLVEPAANIGFAHRYAQLCEKYKLGINDALLLQLMVDAAIDQLFSYDKKLVDKATVLGIKQVA